MSGTPDPVVDAYKPGIDRTLIRENLKRSPDERLRALQQLQAFAEELRRAGKALPYTRHVMRMLTRITADPLRMGGRPCIRDLRVTVGTVVGLVAAGHARDEILRLYPYLENEDITEALAYAAWRADEFEVPLSSK